MQLSYWGLTTGREIDFILNDMEIAIEEKSSSRINGDHLKNIREVKKDFPSISACYVVCLEPRIRKTEDGIVIVPIQIFVQMLWEGAIISASE